MKQIQDLISENKENEIDNFWVNSVLHEVPNEILISNVLLFYYYFN